MIFQIKLKKSQRILSESFLLQKLRYIICYISLSLRVVGYLMNETCNLSDNTPNLKGGKWLINLIIKIKKLKGNWPPKILKASGFVRVSTAYKIGVAFL